MPLLIAVPVALVVAVLTLLLCDLAGGIARAKGRSYWLFFALTLLLWFPGLLGALLVSPRTEVAVGRDPRRPELALGTVVAALGAVTAVAGLAVAVTYAP